MQLFYSEDITELNTEFSFNKEESKHISKVLRKKTGDVLNITNGKGWLFSAEIVQTNIKQCSVKITSKKLQTPLAYRLHLAVAPTKINDRFEWFLEKATEIGITDITPIICENSERKIIKPLRFEKIIQSAMKQSLQCYLPKLHPAITFKQFMQQDISGQLFIAHCEDTDKTSLKSQLIAKQNVTILIGPEGDFSPHEIKMATTHFKPVTLGKTRLRTETAAMVACHTVALTNTL